MLILAQLKWKTGLLKVPFLFSFRPSWFNSEYPLSQAGCCCVLTGDKDIFSSKRATYDCVHPVTLLQKDSQRSIHSHRIIES